MLAAPLLGYCRTREKSVHFPVSKCVCSGRPLQETGGSMLSGSNGQIGIVPVPPLFVHFRASKPVAMAFI